MMIRILRISWLFCFCASTYGQSSGNPKAFCEKDRRPEIAAYCKNLADLQAAVNKERTNPQPNLTSGNSAFADSVEKLHLTSPKAAPNFITATAAAFATKTVVSNVLREAGQARPDRQIGASSNASGTTSLVSKAGSAELLALALDTGVLTRSINGSTATYSTNADQLFRLITGSDPDCIVTCTNLGWLETKILNPTNKSATFDLAQQSSTTATTTGQASGAAQAQVNSVAIPTGAGKFSGIRAKYQLLNRFDPRSDKFKQAWKAQVTSLKENVIAIGDDTDAVISALQTHNASLSGPHNLNAKLVQAAADDASGRRLVEVFEEYWSNAVTADVTQDSTLAAAVAKAVQDRAIYRTAWFKALEQAVGNLFTFEYSYNRALRQPETHDFKIIYAYDFKTLGMVTFNGGISIYGGTLPVGAKYGRLHWGQVSGEYDRTLSDKTSALQTQLSLAGYWQYQPEPSILNVPAGTVVPGTNIPVPNGTQEFVGTAGSLWVTQAKITIKGSGGIEVPIGVSWSNKTDLLQGSKVGGQIGISYNFSSLTGLFGGSSNH